MAKAALKSGPAGDADYDGDFFAWTHEQGAVLRARRHNEVDWENVAEEIEGLGKSQRKEIRSRMTILLVHLLKQAYQPDKQSSSWRGSIMEQRQEISEEITDSPSLKAYPAEILQRQYAIARLKAAEETQIKTDVFPADCPFTVEEALDLDFWPGPQSA